MSLRLSFLVAFLAVLIAAPSTAQVSPQQSPPAAGQLSPPTYVVTGTVINSATGVPVRAALVQTFVPGRSVLTGPDGRFRITGVPQSLLNITVRKPGYFSEQDLSQGTAELRDQRIQVGPGAPPVILKLVPEGVIYGRVSNSAGESVENLPVNVIYAAIVNGERSWQPREQTQTNADGDFRLSGLRPGTYYLRAAQEGHAGTYYPAVPDLSSAAAINITPGKQIRADISIKPDVLYQVSGAIIGAPAGVHVNVQVVSREGQTLSYETRTNLQSGTFVVSLPQGSYTIRASAQEDYGSRSLASRLINVNGDVAGASLVIGPTATIPVNVRFELTHNAALGGGGVPVNLQLVSKEGLFNNRLEFAHVDGSPGNRSLSIRNLEPGWYRARIGVTNSSWYVESARWGPTNLLSLLSGDIAVLSGGLNQPIEIVLRDDFATLDGTASSNGKPGPGVALLLLEVNPRYEIIIPLGPTGQFQTSRLPPGEYRAFAFDRLDGLEYTDPEVMRKFFPASQLVRVLPNGQVTVRLQLQKRGD